MLFSSVVDPVTQARHSRMESLSTNAQANFNLLPYLLLLPLAYLIYGILFPTIRKDFSKPPTSHVDSYNFLPAEHPACALYREYTPKELSVFDGKGLDEHGKPVRILLAIEKRSKRRGEDGVITEVREERTVFDVSAGRSFYGPGEN